MRKATDVDQWIEETVTRFGKLDGAANVAGLAGGDGSNVGSLVRKNLRENRRQCKMADLNPRTIMIGTV